MGDDDKNKDGKSREPSNKKNKLLKADPLEEKAKVDEAINDDISKLKPGDMASLDDALQKTNKDNKAAQNDEIINDLIAADEANQPEEEVGEKISRKNIRSNLINKIPFSWGHLDEYMHQRYENVNILVRCLVECIVIILLFMFFPVLLILTAPYTRSYNIFKNVTAETKTNNYTEFFRENLFVSLCYCIFILFNLLTDKILTIVGYILRSIGIPIEGLLAELIQMLVSSKRHLRNAIVSILVFSLAVLLISDYKFLSSDINLCHFCMTGVFWFFCMSSILFIESFLMNMLLSELRRKSFRGRIWDINYKTFVIKKLAAVADATTPETGLKNERCHMLIRDLKNDFDTGFFLKHNDLNLTSQDQAKVIANDIFAFLHLDDDVLPYDVIQTVFPTNDLEVYAYLSGNSATKETEKFPPISYDTFEGRCVELFQERMDIARSLYDRDNILRKLDFILYLVVLFIGMVIFMMLLNVDYKVYVAAVGPAVFGIGWIFQDSIKELYRCFVFLLLSHPFDCGDRVNIDNEELIVLRIDLLYSTFVTLTGKIKYIPNAAMFMKTIENYRRSDLQSEEVAMTVASSTTFNQLLAVRDKLGEFLKLNQNNFTGNIYIRNYEPAGEEMKVVLSIEHTSNFQDLKPRFIRRDIFLKELERVLDGENISYNHAFTISD